MLVDLVEEMAEHVLMRHGFYAKDLNRDSVNLIIARLSVFTASTSLSNVLLSGLCLHSRELFDDFRDLENESLGEEPVRQSLVLLLGARRVVLVHKSLLVDDEEAGALLDVVGAEHQELTDHLDAALDIKVRCEREEVLIKFLEFELLSFPLLLKLDGLFILNFDKLLLLQVALLGRLLL